MEESSFQFRGRLKDKVVIVTGGATGIGEASRRFAPAPEEPGRDARRGFGGWPAGARRGDALRRHQGLDPRLRQGSGGGAGEVRRARVCPGPIETAWTHKETGPMDEEMEAMVIAATPMGRCGTPEEVANVYAFLASDEASYVTGALYCVDGGLTVAKGAVGDDIPEEIASQPAGVLELSHSLEGRAG